MNIVVEGFIHYGAGGAQEELFVGQRGEHVEVFLVPGWLAHNWIGMKLQHDFTFFLLSLDIFPQSIFVTAASYGKKKLSRELCNGQKDSAQVYTDCLYDATDEVRYSSLVFSGKDI